MNGLSPFITPSSWRAVWLSLNPWCLPSKGLTGPCSPQHLAGTYRPLTRMICPTRAARGV